MAQPVLTTHALTKRFGGIAAVANATLTVPEGRITALTGANGAGKTTLFDCLAGRTRPDDGQVHLDGEDITHLPPHERARRGITRTFQHLAVFPTLTVEENIRLGAEQRHRTTLTKGARALLGLPDPRPDDNEALAATIRTLHRLGLTELRERLAADLPTGTLRLVELGRALAPSPRVLLLDEPAAGLDRAETARLATLLRELADHDGIALLLVEHDAALIHQLADRVYTMTAGHISHTTEEPTR